MRVLILILTIVFLCSCTSANVQASGGIKRAELSKVTTVETDKKRK